MSDFVSETDKMCHFGILDERFRPYLERTLGANLHARFEVRKASIDPASPPETVRKCLPYNGFVEVA